MLKSEFKGQIVYKFDLGLLNAYNSMYFDGNIENKGSDLSCVTDGEFFFRKINTPFFHHHRRLSRRHPFALK